MKKILDSCPDLLADVLDLFAGQKQNKSIEADLGAILHPLPRVPIMISYWKAEEEFDSSLHIFFDRTVEDNLPIDGIFALCTGLVRMFEQIANSHACN